MIKRFFQYFSPSTLRMRVLNRKISVLSILDKDSVIHKTSLINRYTILRKTKIGRYTYVGSNCTFNNVEIGSFCSISRNINIGYSSHPINFISTSPIFFSPRNGTGSKWVNQRFYDDAPKKTFIGHDVWIGANSSVMSGITIGNGAIVGAHSVVTKDIEPYSIVGGVPAKLIRKRFPDKVINSLQSIKWWEMKEVILKNNIFLFTEELTNDKLIRLENENQK
ncbi:CatB-related O-acetyltransferase [Aequorivita marisscotiae]|uniref:CatB-related O-acetyltransferase n=1 Tax=Aequorivita marisscotiae TaxID=3040348 RepID=A0ABY8KWM9_9FLAO|nr:CatB-related O-acetyltransferase [Aequorivita sp. Ant34-E75]WGF92211.1 CatB-related O-acetyltransferase [Aequorivita sp. Ant34-E75]